MVNLRTIAGESDVRERFIDIGKAPTLGRCRFHLDPGFTGGDPQPALNMVRAVSDLLENVTGRGCISRYRRQPWSAWAEQSFHR